MKIFSRFCLIIIIFLIASCASKDKDQNSAEKSYREAMKLLQDHRYMEAAEAFEKVNDDYPLSTLAARAQVMAAYAQYKTDRPEEVLRIVDDFIVNHPANSDVAYMLYLKGRVNYERLPEVSRAQDFAQAASYSFRELIARFPESEYAADAKQKIVIVDQHLSGARMSVGRYDLWMGNYIGAAQNFNYVLKRYSNTNQAPEAYFRLYETYSKIGIDSEAQKALKILQEKYPQSQWAKAE